MLSITEEELKALQDVIEESEFLKNMYVKRINTLNAELKTYKVKKIRIFT
jgi:hypothetical protein